MSDRERMGQAEFQDEAKIDQDDVPDFYQDIWDFHVKFELVYAGPPRELDSDISLFRIGFMIEELAEYAQSSGYTNIARSLNEMHEHIKNGSRWMVNRNELRNIEKQFDSLIDLVYVALGTSHLHGFDFDEGWRRVQVANMAKRRVKSDLIGSTRNSKYDVVKPKGWMPADLSDLVKGSE